MKKTLCSLLVLSVMSAAVPMHAAGPEAAKPAADSKPIATAVKKAGADLAAQPPVKAQKVPTSLPRSGSDRIRKQGKTGMIVGIVSSLVGVAATVYMVNEMKKDSDQD
jgi:hypothetical protein